MNEPLFIIIAIIMLILGTFFGYKKNEAELNGKCKLCRFFKDLRCEEFEEEISSLKSNISKLNSGLEVSNHLNKSLEKEADTLRKNINTCLRNKNNALQKEVDALKSQLNLK